MKKLDKLILKSFAGPFILTFVVVVFILLSQTMIKYFDDFAGKGLGLEVFAELLFYFSIFTTPIALPLAVLLSSLMTFGNLGEHSELTAIKGSGISLLRTLRPIFAVTVVITALAYFNNNYIVPKANLKAYSLLYDIKKKKPALDIKEGAFYSGIRDLRIKVNKKYADGSLEDVIIYDHRNGSGNSQVLLAESGKMYTILGEQYLTLELYNGTNYSEHYTKNSRRRVSYNEIEPYKEDKFSKTKIVLSLAEFSFNRTDEDLFKTNRLMLTVEQLKHDIDSLRNDLIIQKHNFYSAIDDNLMTHVQDNIIIPEDIISEKKKIDSLRRLEYLKPEKDKEVEEAQFGQASLPDGKAIRIRQEKKPELSENDEEIQVEETEIKPQKPYAVRINEEKQERAAKIEEKIALLEHDSIRKTIERVDSALSARSMDEAVISNAVNKARFSKSHISAEAQKFFDNVRHLRKFEIERHKKLAQAVACLIMFLIGAPLGAIIKKGGLGVPVIISIVFFIVYYVFSMTGEKWARQSVVTAFWGVWGANAILLPIGLLFLKQARADARLFDSDFYSVAFNRLKDKIRNLRRKA